MGRGIGVDVVILGEDASSPRDDVAARRQAYHVLVATLRQHLPGFRIAFKDDPSAWMPWHHRFVHAIGREFVPDYDTRFTTVLSPVIYLPAGTRVRYARRCEQWYETLRHEYIHILDAKHHPIWMPLSYAVIPPLGITMRAYWELRGYSQTMVVRHELGQPLDGPFFEHLVDLFAGPAYGYMLWPRPLARRVLEHVRTCVEAGEIAGVEGAVHWWTHLLEPLLRSGLQQAMRMLSR